MKKRSRSRATKADDRPSDYERAVLAFIAALKELGVQAFQSESFSVSFSKPEDEETEAVGFKVEQDEDDCCP